MQSIYSLRNRRVHKSTTAAAGTRNLNGNEHGQEHNQSQNQRRERAEMKAAALRRTALAQINNNIYKSRPTSRIVTKSIIDDEPIQQARFDAEASQMTISNEPSTEPAPVPAPTKDKDNCPFNLPSKFAFLSVTGNRAQPAELWDYAEYAEDVLDYLVQYEKEQRFRIPADLLTNRRASIKSKTYVILVDYIAQLHAEFRLASVIFDLSVYLLNRAILEFKHIDKHSYQIITITCLLIASKYEGIFPPLISELIETCENSVTPLQIVEMELDILRAVGCDLSHPSPATILDILLIDLRGRLDADRYELIVFRSKYFKESLLHSVELCHTVPSHLAAISLLLAAKCADIHIDEDSILSACRIPLSHAAELLAKSAQQLIRIRNNVSAATVRNKFAQERCLSVSDMDAAHLDILEQIAATTE